MLESEAGAMFADPCCIVGISIYYSLVFINPEEFPRDSFHATGPDIQRPKDIAKTGNQSTSNVLQAGRACVNVDECVSAFDCASG